MKRASDDEMVDGWPRARREALAQWAARWIRFAQILFVPLGLIALAIALYLHKDAITALLR